MVFILGAVRRYMGYSYAGQYSENHDFDECHFGKISEFSRFTRRRGARVE